MNIFMHLKLCFEAEGLTCRRCLIPKLIHEKLRLLLISLRGDYILDFIVPSCLSAWTVRMLARVHNDKRVTYKETNKYTYDLCTLFIDHTYMFRSSSATIFRVQSIKKYNKSCRVNFNNL